jgi:hypothetical protein
VIYDDFVNAMARGKANPEKGLRAILVKGYKPAKGHKLADVSPAQVGQLDASGKWDGNKFIPAALDVQSLGIETKDIDGVVFVVGGLPACHCPLEDEARVGNARYFARALEFPGGIFEVTA